MKTELIIVRKSFDGKILQTLKQPSRSWTLGFLALLYLQSCQEGTGFSVTDIAGSARTLKGVSFGNNGNCNNLKVASPGGGAHNLIPNSNNSGYMPYAQTNTTTIKSQDIGIVVGSNNTAVVPQDNKLNTQIAHGKAATQLEYGGCSIGNYIEASPNVTFDIVRHFLNHSGGNVDVNEVGIYASGGLHGASMAAWAFCIARDVLGATVTVADTELLQVKYTVSTTV